MRRTARFLLLAALCCIVAPFAADAAGARVALVVWTVASFGLMLVAIAGLAFAVWALSRS